MKTAYTAARDTLLSQLSEKTTDAAILQLQKTAEELNSSYVKQYLTEKVWKDWHSSHHIGKPTITRDQFLQLDTHAKGNYLWEIQSRKRAVRLHTPGPEDTREIQKLIKDWE